MKKDRRLMFSTVALILGGMLAVQFQTTNNPIVRDTRDLFELRADLENQKQRQQQLYDELSKYQDLNNNYSKQNKTEKIAAMKKALEDLKKQVGLTPVSGQGIVITVEPFNEGLLGKKSSNPSIYPELIQRLINELNRYNAKEIAIDGQRIITRTAVRDVNGRVYINNEPLSPFPIEIQVLADDNQKLNDKIIASSAAEDFVRENLDVESKPVDHLTLPAYDQPMRVKYMEQAKEGS